MKIGTKSVPDYNIDVLMLNMSMQMNFKHIISSLLINLSFALNELYWLMAITCNLMWFFAREILHLTEPIN